MLSRLDHLLHAVDRDTPADRDRYLDLLRVVAIAVVVLGHWLARVAIEPDGDLATGHVLTVLPATQWATWVAQVMPLFFVVGGLLNLGSWRRARAGGTSGVAWVRDRVRRLLRPLLPLLAVWVAISALLVGAGAGDRLPFDPSTAIVPVWFLAAYVLVTALTPVLADRGHVRVMLAVLVAAVAVDAVRFTEPEALAWIPTVEGASALAVLNFLFIWVAVHQLGFWWSEGLVPRRRALQLAMAAAAVAVVAFLVVVAGYPRSMVQVPGEIPANDAPPTLALYALGVAQLGVALAVRPAAERWLARPRVWGTVALAGSRLMTVFLWHQSAMLAVASLVVPTAVWPTAPAVDWRWWALRPLWLLACVAALVPLLLLFGRYEQVRQRRATALPSRVAEVVTAAGVLAVSGSLGGLIVVGLPDPDAPLGLPLVPLLGALAGMAALGVLGQGHVRRILRRPGKGGHCSRKRSSR